MISGDPASEPLRTVLMDHLYEVMRVTITADPRAVRVHAIRRLVVANMDDEAFVDLLKSANEEMMRAVTENSGVAQEYVGFVQEWCRKNELDGNLVRGIFVY